MLYSRTLFILYTVVYICYFQTPNLSLPISLVLFIIGDVLFIIGDWNAKVGSQETPGVRGKFGLEYVIYRSRAKANRVLPRKCTSYSKQPIPTHKRRLYTWTSPDGQHQNQIDYTLCSQRWRSSIQSAKTRPGADCGSDHELLIAKFRQVEESGENHQTIQV